MRSSGNGNCLPQERVNYFSMNNDQLAIISNQQESMEESCPLHTPH